MTTINRCFKKIEIRILGVEKSPNQMGAGGFSFPSSANGPSKRTWISSMMMITELTRSMFDTNENKLRHYIEKKCT